MMNRRDLLRVGAASGLGLTLHPAVQAEGGRRSRARAKSVIFLHQFGGPSQYETFDMKPDAPSGVRGTFKPIPSNVPGMPVCEMLPRMVNMMDKVCLIKAVQHTMKNHNSATYYSLTGHAPPVDDIRLRDSLDLFPAFGSVVDRLAPVGNGIPTFVSYPYVLRDGSITPGQHASFLGKSHNPLFFTQDPNASDFRLPELTLPQELTLERLEDRQEVLRLIDEQAGLLEQSAIARGIDESYQKAVSMLTSPTFKKAFDLAAEPKKVRDAYGRTTYGQSCLLARRLVEAGAKFINVYLSPSIGGDTGGWDTHGFNGKPMDPILKSYLLPLTNQTLPTLLSDLSERGLLDETLVLWMGEFGRTPRINGNGGRDHWPQCYTVLMAGGGVKRGYVHGASDKIGAFPSLNGVRIEDVTATVFELLGIPAETEVRDKFNRPIPISRGSAITPILL